MPNFLLFDVFRQTLKIPGENSGIILCLWTFLALLRANNRLIQKLMNNHPCALSLTRSARIDQKWPICQLKIRIRIELYTNRDQNYWYQYSGPLYSWPIISVTVSNGLRHSIFGCACNVRYLCHWHMLCCVMLSWHNIPVVPLLHQSRSLSI